MLATFSLWVAWRVSERYLEAEKRITGLLLLTFVPFFNFTTLLLSCASPRDFREDGGLCASLRPAENRLEFDDSFSGTFASTNVGGQRELIRPRS